ISQVDGAKVGVAQADTTIVDSSTTPNLAPSVVVTVTITPEQGKAVAGQEVATSVGTDPEGEPLVYSLTPNSNPDGLYAINPQTGQVTLTQQGADHINAGHDLPVVQVTVTDPHGLTGQDNDNNVPSTIDVPAPATAPEVSIVKDADNNGYINADEKGTDTTTDVSVLIPADAKDGDVVTVVDGNGVELIKYTVGQHGVVAGSTQTLTGVMLPNEGETLSVKAFITNVSGSLTGNTDSAIIDTIAPDANNLSIEIISIAGQDNVLNLSEAVITDKLIPVVGKVTGDFLPGNYVTVHVNGKYETVAVDDQGMFTAYFAGTELNADVDRVVEATILARDKAGNLTTKTADKMFTVETAIAPSIDDFTTLTNPIYVSEEGLKNGITDNQGSPDTTNSSVITGQFTFKDPDSSQLSLELEGLTTVQTLSGNDVAWQWDASSNTLKGTANGELVLTVEVAQPVLVSGDKFASDYTIKLHQPILHPVHGIEDVLNLDFNLKVSDGTSTTTGQFAIVVEDDMPSIDQNAHVDIVLQKQPAQTNLLVGFDVSSSMNSPAILDGKPATRLDVTQKALSDAIKQYDSGDNEVMVKMVLFGREANTVGNTWMTASDALAWIATLRDYADANINRGSTNYEDTLAKMMDAFAHPGKFTGSDANNVSIFLTDGHPNVSMGDNNGLSGTVNGGHDSPRISKAEEKVWTDWLKTNNIKSYAYSAHIGSDSSAIDPIAYDGKTSTDLDGLAATDTSGLAQNLTENTSISIQSVTATGDGSVFINDNTISGQFTGFGADGGYVSKVVIGGATYTFDGKDITTPNGTMTNTSFVSINTPQGGKLVVDMATAKYSYTSAVNKSAYQEQMTYTVVDGDGDGVESKQTWNVVVKDVDGNTSINGKATLDVIDGSIKGLNGEYYGYNDQVVAGNKVHADDTKYGNLQTISDMEGIINGRNGADVVGTNASAHQGAPDARFTATTINYGNVRTSLGTNTSLASGETAGTGGLTTSNSQLYKFLSKSNSDGNSIVAESGLGNTTDAGIRVTGNIYLEPGQYDFRVYSDDGFRLLLDGQSVIEYDNIRAPDTSTATGVQIKGGLVPVELLYWEQGAQGVLNFEYKPSHETEWKTLDLSDTLMLRDNSLDLNILQDIVMVNDEWHVRTGDVISGTNPKDQEFITGTEAKDIIYGGKMNDALVGGKGADLFVYNTQVDNDNDIIKDFTVGVDKIVLSDVIDVNAQNLGINLDNPAWAGKDSVSDMAWNDSTKTLSFKTADGGSNAITFENMTESYTDLDAFLKANAIL
ncbi:PA14 domain-containing protein, partial [Moraxella sp. VT-16-12]|uniref:PA14 domain-containing protein n=1 Tax=Moraxella sp. VT-16-12 TaxID=2014877 RepID=UPI0011B45B44